MAGRYIKNQKIVAVALSVLLLAVTVSMGVIATGILKNRPNFGQGSSKIEAPANDTDAPSQEGNGEEPTPGEGDNPTDDTQGESSPKTFPDEMRAVYLTPGVDYLKGEGEAETNARIDQLLNSAKEMTMNTVIINTNMDGKVIFPSSVLPMAELSYDPLPYLISKAKELGLYTYMIFPTLSVVGDEVPSSVGKIEISAVDRMESDIKGFCQRYQPNGVIIDGYYNVGSGDSYSHYLGSGGAIGYESYMYKLSETVFVTASEEFRKQAPWLHVGMMTEPVWANSSYNADGSATSAGFTTMYTGNTDSRKLIEYGYADFVAVKAGGSIDDGNIPYKAVVQWWANETSQKNIPLYVIHYSSKAATDAVGWSEYDQLARQVIEAKKLDGFGGSIFNSISRLEENPKDCAVMLVKYYNNEVNPTHLLTDLTVTKPAKRTYTTFEPTVTFTGASDPNTSVTINKKEITTDSNGYFTTTLPLDPGLNTFDFYHKGKTDKYNITRQVKVVDSITPMGNMNIDGGMRLTISAIAYSEATVNAYINGQTVKLTPTDEVGDTSHAQKESDYKVFTGVYTVPAATSSVQKLGNIVVKGEWSGFKDTVNGAAVNVNKRMPVVDGKPVVVVADQAPTFSATSLDEYGDPDFYPLPKGAIDYTVGSEIVYARGNKTYSYYMLKSGLRVNTEDIASVSDANAVGGNSITGVTVTADNRYTNVIISTSQPVSYIGRYDGSKFTVDFNYTNSAPASMNLSKNPLFSAANWSGTKLTLPMVSPGCFMGYYAYYDNSGNLVLRFNNAPSSLNGAKIAIDPGHGGNDPGSLGFLAAYPEKVINTAIAKKLSAELRSRGASVAMLDTFNNNLSLQQRLAQSQASDPHIFISVHGNSALYSAPTGSEAYYFYPFAANLSKYAAANMSKALGTINRGGKHGQYYVTRTAQYPAILVETGFLSNEGEYRKLIDDGYQSELANALANAIDSYIRSMQTSKLGATGTQSSGKAANTTAPSSSSSEQPASSSESSSGGSNGTKANKITLSEETSISLSPDDMTSITAYLEPEDASGEITWSYKMTNEDVAEVSSDGDTISIVALNPGKITVTASVKGSTSLKASCEIIVE